MTASRIYRRIVHGLKTIIWRLAPGIVRWFYKTRRLRHDSIVLVIHEGLGDLASMVAAIKEASIEHKRVYVVSRKTCFDAISLVFQFNDNVKNIPAREGKWKKYVISKKRMLALQRYGYVIKIGSYDGDPIFGYPNSFYLKLGYAFSLAAKRFYFDLAKYRSTLLEEFLNGVGKHFVFFSNETTNGYLETCQFSEIPSKYQIVTFTSDTRILQNARIHDISQLNETNFTRSLLNSMQACFLAEYAVISDAGLFNILIRLENQVNIRVLWRQYPHDLNIELYGEYIESRV